MSDRLYSVLLVDDEEDVIRIIMNKIDWAALGFRLAGYAHNGVEALEIAEEEMPDVVLTDIKMPFMDGLTLGRKLKERDSEIKLIIFSGFDEFEYAKEAIKLEVEEYLLKPVDQKELTEVFTRVKENLDRERDERENIDKLQDYYMESLPMLQESFFTSLLENRVPQEQIPQYLENYRISMEGPRYLAAIVHVSGQSTDGQAVPAAMNAVLRQMQVRKMLEDQLAARYRAKVLVYLRDLVMIVQIRGDEEITRFTDDCDNFCHMAKRFIQAPVTIGIGAACEQIGEIPVSYEGAGQALSYRAIYGNSRAINITEIAPAEVKEDSWHSDFAAQIIREIRLGDKESLDKAIDECISSVAAEGASYEKYRIYLLGLLSELSNLVVSNGLEADGILADAATSIEMIFHGDSPEQMRGWLRSVTESIQEAIAGRREHATTSFVTKAIEYVEQHFADKDISIESVCSELAVSAAYFSTVFKKETGKTFISYLTDYRMDKAVERLLTTDERTYMIAEKVGYADSNYFSYVFKKQYGISPSKYRQEKLGDRK